MTGTAAAAAPRTSTAWRVISTSLRHVENTLAALAFATITIVTFANVVGRYLLDASIALTTEVTVNLAVLLTMVGAAVAVRERAHLGFTLLHDMSRGRLRVVVSLFVTTAVCLFFGVLAWFGFDHAVNQLAAGRLTAALGIPQGLFTMALPLGSVLAIIRALEVGVGDIRAALGTGSIIGRQPRPAAARSHLDAAGAGRPAADPHQTCAEDQEGRDDG